MFYAKKVLLICIIDLSYNYFSLIISIKKKVGNPNLCCGIKKTRSQFQSQFTIRNICINLFRLFGSETSLWPGLSVGWSGRGSV